MRVFHFSCVIFINTFIVLKLFFLEGIFKTTQALLPIPNYCVNSMLVFGASLELNAKTRQRRQNSRFLPRCGEEGVFTD